MATINTELLSLSFFKKWAPLKEIVREIEPNKFFDPHYYSINDHIYLQASQFYKNDFINTTNAPFVTAILYTGGHGSACRIVHANIENDDSSYISIADSLWDKNFELNYRGALDFFKFKNIPSIESASYRIATDGAFICKTIENKKI